MARLNHRDNVENVKICLQLRESVFLNNNCALFFSALQKDLIIFQLIVVVLQPAKCFQSLQQKPRETPLCATIPQHQTADNASD